MNLVVGSCFRNSNEAFVAKYFARIHALRDLLNREHAGHALHLVLVWGDSPKAPELAKMLQRYGDAADIASVQVLERSHGFPDYGSSTHPDRISGFAYAANGVFERIGDGADVVMYVESDLIWNPLILRPLVARVQRPGSGVIGPMTMTQAGAHYDFWAWRDLQGRHIGALPPYFADGVSRKELVEVSSGGSCLIMAGRWARTCRCTPEEALVGFCKQVRAAGGKIWLDLSRKIQHP